MSYTAAEMIQAIAHANWCSKQAREPRHIIDQNGTLRVVKTVTPGDKVIVTGIQSARRTSGMIETHVEAMTELRTAIPHITRAVQIIEARHSGVTVDEVLADLMQSARIHQDNTIEQEDKPSFFARLFGRVAY